MNASAKKAIFLVLLLLVTPNIIAAEVFLDVCIDQKKDKGFNLKFLIKEIKTGAPIGAPVFS